jgi:predicted alpha/beta hydrolase
MSWTTTAVKIKHNEPREHEFHNWNEDNLKVALKWLKKYAEGHWIVTIYHRTDGGRS